MEGMMITAQDIKADRLEREGYASAVAEDLPDGDYYADGVYCVDRLTGVRTACGTHWDACLVMMAVSQRMAA
jgi:hypothetical protein